MAMKNPDRRPAADLRSPRVRLSPAITASGQMSIQGHASPTILLAAGLITVLVFGD